jgi:hypothetical protein
MQPSYQNQNSGPPEIKGQKLYNKKIKFYMKNGRRKFPDGVSKRSTLIIKDNNL